MIAWFTASVPFLDAQILTRRGERINQSAGVNRAGRRQIELGPPIAGRLARDFFRFWALLKKGSCAGYGTVLD